MPYGPPDQEYTPYPAVARRRMSPWKIAGIGCLVLLLCLGIGGYIFLKSVGLIPTIPKKQVLAGEALKWRTIESWSGGGGEFATIFSGYGVLGADFTGDGNEEICYRHSSGLDEKDKPPTIVDPHGTPVVKLAKIPDPIFAGGPGFLTPNEYVGYEMACWDYNGDGISEIAAWDSSGPHIQFVDLKSRLVAKLASNGPGELLPADLDGDGQLELVTLSNAATALVAYGVNGKQVWNEPVNRPGNHLAGDVDGDGRDEVLDYDGHQLLAHGMQQQPQPITWKSYWPDACADLTGDGRAEVISGDWGYLDLATGSVTAFQYPSGRNQGSGSWGGRIAIGDFNKDKQTDVAVIGPQDPEHGLTNTGLYIFSADGKLWHYEELGETAHVIAAVHTKSQDYLAVLLDGSLLIWP